MSKRPFFSRHRLAFGVAAGVIVIALSANTILGAVMSATRLSQINAIYGSLKLGNEYSLVSESVFGDKRVYQYDKGRTQSSQKIYMRQADVDVTVAELRAKIDAAGFKYIGEPYPGSLQTQLHFESKDHHYIRLTVSSYHRDSVARSGDMSLLEIYDKSHSPKEAPSEVTIKVNLDDNNE